MSKVIHVYDEVFDDSDATIIEQNVRQLHWHYDYHSNKNEINKHWHISCGRNKEECVNGGYSWVDDMFEIFKTKFGFNEKYRVENYERIYCNAHTHGLEPHMHTDDGNFTMLYYPRLDWKSDAWGGGTLIDGQLVPYLSLIHI